MALAKEVGHCIRALRRQHGLTQAALAEQIDRSEVALRAIERGASAPSFETLQRLTLALNIPAAALFPAAPPGDGSRQPETARRVRELATMAALARDFSDTDLALAYALLTAVAKAASER